MRASPEKYGVRLGPDELVLLWEHRGYVGWQLKTPRQQVDIVLTPTGLIRLGEPQKRQEYPKVDE